MSKSKFIYNGILLTLVGFAMRGVGLFLGAYVSAAIGAEGMGLQGLIATVYSFAVTFATSGVSLSVTRLVAASIGEGKSGGDVLRGAFIYALTFGLTASLILFVFADLIGAVILADARVSAALRILSLSLVPIALSGVISGYFVSVRRVGLNAAVQIFGQLMRICLTVFLLSRADTGLAGAIRALALGTTVTECACFLLGAIEFRIDRLIHRAPHEGGVGLDRVARMALPLAFSAYVRAFLLSVEHSLIPKRLVDRGNSQSEALASYGYLGTMAIPIILFPMTPLSSFSGLLVPEFAECEGGLKTERMRYMATVALEKALVYATVVAVFILTFSEELGYVIYDTYEAGRYIGLLAPVIPIMYLDHVTDSMLKGIGEQVYSMWVNIADSLLSVLLVWVLIPIFDIYGYALVIILMECFNFILSYIRLRRRISFRLHILGAFILPLVAALLSVTVTGWLFDFCGRATTWLWLTAKAVFSASLTVALLILPNLLKRNRGE